MEYLHNNKELFNDILIAVHEKTGVHSILNCYLCILISLHIFRIVLFTHADKFTGYTFEDRTLLIMNDIITNSVFYVYITHFAMALFLSHSV